MERYNNVRRRLDQLNYKQGLDQKSVQLVEKMLNDLIRTTEGFQQLKRLNGELIDKAKHE
jgi:centrosomal protein CEP135